MADAAELRELEDDELFSRLADSRRELLNLRFQLATGQLDNSARVGLVKKDVARILTLLRDREIALAEGRDAGPVMRTDFGYPEDRPPRRRARAQVEAEQADDLEDEAAGDEEWDDEADELQPVDEVETEADGDAGAAEDDAEEDE